MARPGLGRDGRHPPAVDVRPAHRGGRGRGRYDQRGPASTARLADAWFAQTSGLAPWRATGCGSPTARPRRCGTSRPGRCTPRWDRAVRLRLPRRPGRPGAAPAPARRHRAARRHVAISDTYNGAVRRYDPADRRGHHPGQRPGRALAAYVDGRRATELVVVESAAHRLTRVPLGHASRTDGFSHTTQRPVTEVAETLSLEVAFTPPPGQKVDDRFGPPSQLVVEATPSALLRKGEGRGTELTRTLVLDPEVGEGVLHVAARAASCDIAGARTPPATSTSRTGASRSGSRPAPSRSCASLWAIRLRADLSFNARSRRRIGSRRAVSAERQHQRDAEHGQPDQHVEHLPGARPRQQRRRSRAPKPSPENHSTLPSARAGREPPASGRPVVCRRSSRAAARCRGRRAGSARSARSPGSTAPRSAAAPRRPRSGRRRAGRASSDVHAVPGQEGDAEPAHDVDQRRRRVLDDRLRCRPRRPRSGPGRETAQIATTGPTCSRARPCRSTKAFCAPIATISDRPVSRPATAASSTPTTLGRLPGEDQRNFMTIH